VAYVEYFHAHVLPELRAIDGYEGAQVLVGGDGPEDEIVVVTWWRSLDAVRAFAGEPLDVAVVHDGAAALLTSFDRRVTHYDVAVDD
jgi:heme-degrading monooxygenase HmoA